MTGNMKGYAIEKDGSRRIVTVPIPKPDPYQALVKIEACGVCNGTDIKLAHQNFKNFSTYPALLGHEAVGSIVELGEKVSSFRTGDRVTLPFGEDTAGYYSGWGGYSEYGLVGDIAAIQADGLTPDSPYWVGVSAIINTAMSLIVPGGKICCYGISPNLQMNLDWSRAPYNWGLQFEQWPSKIQEGEQHKQICGWIESGQLVPSQYISEEIPFEEIDRAFDMIEQKKTDLKNVIVF